MTPHDEAPDLAEALRRAMAEMRAIHQRPAAADADAIPVPHWRYEAAQRRLEADDLAPAVRGILERYTPTDDWKEPTPGERQDPREQSRPRARRRRGTITRRRRR